jgi:ABC-type lipoprotein export system ATPase subunit
MRVEVVNLGHAYPGNEWLFRGLTFTFEPGRTYALTGASGSGKSTLMAILSGWTKAREGALRLEGVTSTSWVFQNPHGVPKRTAIDHVAFPLIAAGMAADSADERASELMGRFRLSDVRARQFRHLSGGEAQRLMLARATASGPDLLLVDEPTAQLDRATAQIVNAVLSHVVSPATVVIVATHDQETRDACDLELDLSHYSPKADRS